MANPLQLKSLNHISLVCGSVEKSVDFYVNVLGFIPIKRPSSLDFNGAWYVWSYETWLYTSLPKFMRASITFSQTQFARMLFWLIWFMILCRLFNYGIGIHLLQSNDPEGMPKHAHINPKDNHISFQVSFSLCLLMFQVRLNTQSAESIK